MYKPFKWNKLLPNFVHVFLSEWSYHLYTTSFILRPYNGLQEGNVRMTSKKYPSIQFQRDCLKGVSPSKMQHRSKKKECHIVKNSTYELLLFVKSNCNSLLLHIISLIFNNFFHFVCIYFCTIILYIYSSLL